MVSKQEVVWVISGLSLDSAQRTVHQGLDVQME